jgi:predicted alpha/beta superfamily hydrolase
MKSLFFIAILLFYYSVNAQYPPVTIAGTEIRTITSSVVNGQEYELQILLPGGYSKTDKKYPVVYLMDSQWDFPLVKSIYGQQYYDGFIPQLILVGVTWGGNKPNPDSLRARDYTPSPEARLIQSGGADAFLSFMHNELFPFIEKNYKADPANRTLMGCSLGGLFTMYALFTHTGMFNGYVAASPATGWDREVLYTYEKSFSKKELARPVRLYLTVGDVETNRPSFEKMAAFLQERRYKNVAISSKVLENTGHSGTKSETYGRGLQFVFQRPDLALGVSALNRYTGLYKLQDGRKAEIVISENKLTLKLDYIGSYKLSAAGEAEFYSTAEFLNIHFKTNAGKVEGFELERYGNTQSAVKAN